MSLATAHLVPILVILLLACFIAMIAVMRHYFQQGMLHTLTRLQSQGAENDKMRQQLQAELAKAKAESQAQMAKAQAEVEALRLAAQHEADAQRQTHIDQARQEAERIIQQAMQARNALVHEVDQFMRTRAVKLAVELLQDSLPADFREVAHTHWVDKLIRNGLVSKERLSQPAAIRGARVISAYPLTEEQRTVLQERLQQAIGHDIEWQEAVDARLIAGLIIDLGDVVLDGSLASKLREAAQHARDASGE